MPRRRNLLIGAVRRSFLRTRQGCPSFRKKSPGRDRFASDADFAAFATPYDGEPGRHGGGPVTRSEAETMLRRHEITDAQWDAIKDFLPGKEGDRGVTAKDNRLFVNAVLWIAKTGAPWRDLPERFGPWHNVFQRYNRWCKKGVFKSIMDKFQDPDLEVLILDSTVIRAHQHAAGAEGSSAEAEALGRSRGGFSTKIHLACDGLGKPVQIILTPGQDHDVTQGPQLIAGSTAKKVLADKGYDSDALIEQIRGQGAEAVIPPRTNRTEAREYDKTEYKKRNVVERMINVLKQCRRVATRYEKTARNFLGFVGFAAMFVLLN